MHVVLQSDTHGVAKTIRLFAKRHVVCKTTRTVLQNDTVLQGKLRLLIGTQSQKLYWNRTSTGDAQ